MTTAQINHGRAPDKTQLSIALPKALLEDIEKVGAHHDRNRNKMINILLQRGVNEEIKKMIESQNDTGVTDEVAEVINARTKLSKADPLYLTPTKAKELLG